MNTPTVKPSPLGRGLSALFGDADTAYQPKPAPVPAAAPAAVPPLRPAHSQMGYPAAAPAAERPGEQHMGEQRPGERGGGIRTLPLTWLQPGAFQPRRHFDAAALQGLADSIRARGILEPLLVRPLKGMKDAYEIIAGERRWRAAQQAGLHEAPAIVRDFSDRESLEFGLIENVQRQDLSPLEEAEGYRRLIEEFAHTQDDLARIVGKSRPHITNLLRLLTLPEAVKQLIDGGKLTVGHARAIVPARDPAALAAEIVRKGLNVRQAEALAKRDSGNARAHKKTAAALAAPNADTLLFEKELERVIGLKVKIEVKPGGKAGALTLFYSNVEQFDDILQRLKR